VRTALALAALALAWSAPGAAAAPAVTAARVPILEYHVIADPAPGAPNQELYVSPTVFRAQLDWLERHGYHPVTLDELFRSWRSKGKLGLPSRPVVLTFDDGYPEDVSVVMPELRARGWRAVLNLQIGNLVPARVRELVAAGWEVDAHTFTHPDLTTVGPMQLHREVSTARKWIQNVFRVPVDFFCYPAGRYDDAVLREVRRAGYLGGEAEGGGAASPTGDPYTLPRIEVLRSAGVTGLAAQLGQTA
jgi:peptidoglycan/xylan/chitin deacetylase (PgdA/CDA1 family)